MTKYKAGDTVYYYSNYNWGGYIFFKVLEVNQSHLVVRRLVKERFDHTESIVEGWVSRLSRVAPTDAYQSETVTKVKFDKIKKWDGKPLSERGKSFFNTALAPIK